MYLHHMYKPFFLFRMSASCTHVSALLDALVAATFSEFTTDPPVQRVTQRKIYPSLLTLANGKLLKNANRAPFTLLILCLKSMCTAR